MRRTLVIAGIAVVIVVSALIARRGRQKLHDAASTETGSAVGHGRAGATASGSGGGERPTLGSGVTGDIDATAAPGTIVGRVGSDGTVTISDIPRGHTDGESSSNDYTVGGVHVRDHRGSGAKPIDVPLNTHPPGTATLDGAVTSAIGQKVRAVIYACAREAPREGRGTTPRIDGQFVSNIRGGEMKIISAFATPRDLGDAATPQIKSCVESKVVGLTTTAPNQADADNYGINISLRVP